jgi:signal transduction histidine kinase
MRTILELLYNAFKYSDKQHISLSVEGGEGGDVHFIVQDTGPGMDADYLNLMFKPFTKINDLSEGLGLGLHLCRRHALNLGGDIVLDPDYHAGCRFIVSLPL